MLQELDGLITRDSPRCLKYIKIIIKQPSLSHFIARKTPGELELPDMTSVPLETSVQRRSVTIFQDLLYVM